MSGAGRECLFLFFFDYFFLVVVVVVADVGTDYAFPVLDSWSWEVLHKMFYPALGSTFQMMKNIVLYFDIGS
jgi:hypothetical protein